MASLLLLLIQSLSSIANPIITTPTTININESTVSKFVVQIQATGTGTITYGLQSGLDTSNFIIDPVSGNLSFKFYPDYEYPGGRSITATSVTATNTYQVTIVATDDNGPTTLSLTINVLNVNENPDPPRNLFIISQNQSNLLNWTESVVTTGITEYRIYRSEDSVTWNFRDAVTVGTTSYTDANLQNGQFYFYCVRAWNGVSESVNSNVDASTPYGAEISNYMQFDGDGDYLVASDSIKLMGMPLIGSTTMECWVRFNTLPADRVYILSRDYNMINTGDNGSTVLRWYSLYYEPDGGGGKFVFEYNARGTTAHQRIVKSVTIPTVNTWYHIAGTYSYSYPSYPVSIYINGVLEAQQNGPNSNILETINSTVYPAESRFVIGATTTGFSPFTYGNFLDGDICEARYWTTDRNSASLQANMYTRLRGDETGLIGLWHLDALFNNQVYNYDNLNFNAVRQGDVHIASPEVQAVNDTVSVLASILTHIDVKENDIFSSPRNTVLTKIIKAPANGTASVINRDSIAYNPACFIGTDTIKYVICDTTFFRNPYQYSDTAIVIINSYDNLNPSISCVSDQSRNADAGVCTYTTLGTEFNPTATSDNCSIASISNNITGTSTLAGHALTLGTTNVLWTVTDGAGNTSTCGFNVTVSDNQSPTITCPGNQSRNADAGVCTYTVSGTEFDPTITDDNCSIASVLNNITGTSTLAGHAFASGATNVVWTITDGAGNIATCGLSVIVSDNQNPTIVAPADVTVVADPILHTASGVDLGTPVSSDNCGVATVTNDAPEPFPIGITNVTWTVTDINSNTATAVQVVTVLDNSPPVITSPDIASTPENTVSTITVTATDPNPDDILRFSITGGDDASKFILDPLTGALSFIVAPDYETPTDANTDNIYTVEVTVTDPYELTDTKSMSITVTDVNESPSNLSLSNYQIEENLPVNTFIGTLESTDQDIDDSHDYTFVQGSDEASFSIVGNTIESAVSFNYEQESSYSLTIRSTDNNGAFFDKTISITIINVNETPVILDENNIPADTLHGVAYINEITEICLNTSDPDNDLVTVSSVTSLNENGSISISSGSTGCLNYEPLIDSPGTDFLSIQVCDNGSPSLCNSVIMVLDIRPRFIIPQAISPNNDGINDRWIVGGIDQYTDNTVTIFNRQGNIVYKVKGYDNSSVIWNGDSNSRESGSFRELPAGTYFYTILINGADKLSGFVVLKR